MADGPPPQDVLTVGNAAISVAGAAAALMIRLTGADGAHEWRYVMADIAGTLALFYLAFLGLIGSDWNPMLAVSIAGFAAAAGWAAIFGLLRAMANKRIGG